MPIDTAALKDKMQEVAERELGPGKRSGDHVNHACPFVAEKTPGAFTVYSDHFKCFSCGISGDVITFIQMLNKVSFQEACQQLGAGTTDFEAIALYRQEREVARIKAEQEKKDARLAYNDSKKWQEYHFALDTASRERWRQWGIPDSFQNWWKLGYAPDRQYEVNEQLYHTTAYVMPIWSFPNGVVSSVMTSQFRLTNPVEGAGKFRFERGLGTAAFITRNDWEAGKTAKGDAMCLVVEGPRKAATARIKVGGDDLQIIGIPSKLDTGGVLESLKLYAWVYVWLDPDVRVPPPKAPSTWEAADVKLCKAIGVDKSSYIRYGEKIDDALLSGHLDKNMVMRLMRQSESV